jgi:tetratricopeptide (TPR) repeat protein
MSSTNQPVKNRVSEKANELFKNHQLASLEQELIKLKTENLNLDEQKTWHHFYGVAAFNRNERNEALRRFQLGLEQFPNDLHLQFSLGQEFEFIGEIEKAFELFKKSSFPNSPSKHTLVKARYAYLWSRYDDGLSFLQPIFETYEKLKIIDDTFLYLRGLPFFSETWGYFVSFCFLTGNLLLCKKRLDYYKKNLQDYDFQSLSLDLSDLENNDTKSTISRDQKTIEIYKKNKVPHGVPSARLNLFEMRTSDFQTAKEILKKWLVEPNDFRWLMDIRLLSEAELLWKNNDPAETSRIDAFLINQPLLFEPNHVSFFRLFSYQEKLKTIYVQKKQRASL